MAAVKYVSVLRHLTLEKGISSDKVGVYEQFFAQEDGKPTVMRFIIRDQAEMADYWEGE